MTETPPPPATSLSFAAVERAPLLVQQVRASISSQAARVRERVAQFIPRPDLVGKLEAALREAQGGLLRLEGAVGSGVTTLLCQFATASPAALWLGDDDGGLGVQALCAQLIALGDLPIPLVPPAAGSDPRVLEDLLGEAAERWRGDGPLVVILDGVGEAYQANYPALPVFPARLPQNVVVVYGCSPGAALPLPAKARLALGPTDTPPRPASCRD